MDLIEIPALEDNFIWLYAYSDGKAFAIDPGDSQPVLQTLKKYNLSLTAVLLTHHHWDHTGGVGQLKKVTGCQVIAADTRIAEADVIVADDQIMKFDAINLKAILTPGHTKKSVCYFLEGQQNSKPILWTGDTLFLGGCGRVFETDMATMFQSLNKLKSLPDDTIICPGHDYTQENYRFALTIEPGNKEIQNAAKYAAKHSTSTLSQQIQINVFLKAENLETFTKLRQAKDVFTR
jgi:hydroxyacylglutathione hydrolase